MKIKIVIVIAVLLVLSNILALMLNKIDCKYSNYGGTFTFEEMNSKERNFNMAIEKFAEFKRQGSSDTVLYRLCQVLPLKFWNWGSYLFSKKFNLTYVSWEQVKLRRGPINNRSGFQDF